MDVCVDNVGFRTTIPGEKLEKKKKKKDTHLSSSINCLYLRG